MNINAMPPYNPTAGIRTAPTKVSVYAPKCYIVKDVGQFKDYNIRITRNYLNNKLASTLYYVTDKAGKWLRSKLKYIEGDKKKVLRSENKCLNG